MCHKAYKLKDFCYSEKLLFINYLKNVELQIIGRPIPRPQNRMVGCPGAVFDLAQAAVGAAAASRIAFCEELRRHEMGAGAGGEVAAVLYRTQTANIDPR